MKNNFLYLLATLIILSSCTKIEPEKTINKLPENINSWGIILNSWSDESGIKKIWDKKIFPDKNACWEKTCALQEYLEKLEQEWKINKSKTEYFQERFWVLTTRFKEKDILVKTPEFKKFVEDFYDEYFPCDWKVEVCTKKSAYSYDEQNFIWYIFMPQIVAIEFQAKLWADDSDTESIIQAIRRNYYASYDEKEAMEKVWKDKLEEKVKKIDISKIDKKKLKEDKAYFEEIILTPSKGIFDQVFDNILNPIPWEEKWQRLYTRNIVVDLFLSKIKELWINKDYFYKIIWTSEDNFKKLDEKLNEMNKKYWLQETIPYDRFLRHDEIANYFFLNLPNFNKKWDFNKDTVEVRHYTLLQFAYPDEDLYLMPDRAKKFNWTNNFMGENIVKYTKYMDKLKY